MVTMAARDRVNCIAMYTCGGDGFNLSIVLYFRVFLLQNNAWTTDGNEKR